MMDRHTTGGRGRPLQSAGRLTFVDVRYMRSGGFVETGAFFFTPTVKAMTLSAKLGTLDIFRLLVS